MIYAKKYSAVVVENDANAPPLKEGGGRGDYAAIRTITRVRARCQL